jgi:3-hydroxyisobutyrate dehydrogenase
MSTPVAFIGLGIMGLPMAGHLLSRGHKLTVHTRTRHKAQSLLQRGATWADSPADAARQADFVFVCVPDTPDVQRVVTGSGGLLEGVRPGLMIVDHSTISPAATQQMAQALAQRQTHLLDAPVSGGDIGAQNGTLSIMVGGDRAAFERAQPLLAAYGKTITYCGPSGSGQLTKLVNQVLVTLTNLAVCEALALAKRGGLDLATTVQAVGSGAAASWQLANLGPKMIAGDFRPGFMVDLQQKDLRLVMEAAAQSHTPLPATALVHQFFTAAQAAGFGREGTQALFKVIEKLGS